MKLLKQNKWRINTAASLFVFLHKWGDTAATSDLTLRAFCSLPGVKLSKKPMQTAVLVFARGSHLNLKSKCQDYPKNQRSGSSPLTSFWTIFSFWVRRDIAGGQLLCGVRVRSCPVMSFVPFSELGRCQRVTWRVSARPRRPMDDAKLKTFHKNPASWKGGWEWEEWRCVLKAQQRLGTCHHCWHHIARCDHLLQSSGFLPDLVWLSPGVLPKALECFCIFTRQ